MSKERFSTFEQWNDINETLDNSFYGFPSHYYKGISLIQELLTLTEINLEQQDTPT